MRVRYTSAAKSQGRTGSYRLSPPCLRLFAGAHHGTRAVVCYSRNEALCVDSSVVNSQVSRYPLSEWPQVCSQLVAEVGREIGIRLTRRCLERSNVQLLYTRYHHQRRVNVWLALSNRIISP